jgi:hypothetical protein
LPLSGGTLTGALNGTSAVFSSSVTTSNGIISNYGRINGRFFITNESDYGDMTSTSGMVSIGYYPAGQEATIRSRNYSTSTNTKLTFDASQFNFSGGNVGIGTTSLGTWAKLQVAGNIATTSTGYYWSNDLVGGSTPAYLEYNYGSSELTIGSYGASSNGYIRFTTGGSPERMRITSGGNVFINATSGGNERFNVTQSGAQWAMALNHTNSTQFFVDFRYNGTQTGSIIATGGVTSYNVTSDYRLKQDLKEFNGIELISKIKTYDFEFKSSKLRMYGVIAHELQDVIPYAVFGEKDAKEMQQVDYSKLTPINTKAIQELYFMIQEMNETIKNQKAQIDELKNK